MQSDLGDEGTVGVVVTLFRRGPAEDLSPDDAVAVVAAGVEEYAPKANRCRGGQSPAGTRPRPSPCPMQSIVAVQEWASTTWGYSSSAFYTPLEQITRIQVVVRGPLEELTPALL